MAQTAGTSSTGAKAKGGGAGRSSGSGAGTSISILGLVLLNVTAVISLNNLPSLAEYGLSSIFYYIFAAVFFLIPVALVAAELATGWPEKGGVFRWVGEAFKGRLGFMAMFLAFVEVCVFLPTGLTFGAVSLAYINPNEAEASKMSANSLFVLVVVLVVYWLAVLVALRGSAGIQSMAKWGGLIGVFIPMAVLVGFGIAYAAGGNTPEMSVGWSDLIPDFSKFSNIVLAASVFLMYAGMEMNAVHVKQVKNPSKNYPKAIFIAAAVVVLIFVSGTLVVAYVVPQKDINLTQAILTTYFDIFKWAGVPWLGSVIAVMLAVGVLVNVTTWVAGPSTGLLTVAKAGYLPRGLQKTNKAGQPYAILLLQSSLVTILAVLFVLLPSVQSAYQILNQLANLLYLTVYMLMFAAVIRLRYSEPDQPRPFRLGKKGNGVIWIIAGIGFLASLIAYVFSFIPPDQIKVGSPISYFLMLLALVIIFYLIPNAIYHFRKPSWNQHDPDFAPFNWQKKETSVAGSTSNPSQDPQTSSANAAGTSTAKHVEDSSGNTNKDSK